MSYVRIIEDPTMTVECRTAIKEIFLYFNVCPSVKLESFSYSFTSISFVTIYTVFTFIKNIDI